MKIDRSQIKNMVFKLGATPSGKYDFYYSNDNSEYCYVPILKNAHTWGKTFFQKYAHFLPSVEIDAKHKKFIVFVREPITRWLSATTQWFSMHHYGSELYDIDKTMMDLIFSVVKCDPHADPQIDFLRGIPLKSCTFFDIGDPSFEDNLKYFLNKNKICRFAKTAQDKKNTTEQSSFKRHIKEQLENAMNENVEYKLKVYEYYKKDIDLFQKIELYVPK